MSVCSKLLTVRNHLLRLLFINNLLKFLEKLDLEIGDYKKALPIGGSSGEVSESLHLLRSVRRPRL